jgi:hypothetical protein
MHQSGVVALTITCALLVGMGIALVWLAPNVQRAGIRMMGEPRNRLAVWSQNVAASRTSPRSIRATGAMCIAGGAALIAFLVSR